MTEMLDQEQYAEHVGDLFRVGLDDDAVIELTLIEVSGVGPLTTKHATDAGKPAPFSVLFRGPVEPVLPQATYRLSHAVLGRFDLFLVPVGGDDEAIRYEAVFG